MFNKTFAVIFSAYTLVSIIAGIIYGNKKLKEKEQSKILGSYFTWFVIKQFFISVIFFAIFLFITESLFQSKVWDYVFLLVFGITNFLYAKHKVFEEYEIMFKPGVGILTPEGRQRLIDLENKSSD